MVEEIEDKGEGIRGICPNGTKDRLCLCIIPVLGRQRRANICELEDHLVYRIQDNWTFTQQNSVLKKENNNSYYYYLKITQNVISVMNLYVL